MLIVSLSWLHDNNPSKYTSILSKLIGSCRVGLLEQMPILDRGASIMTNGDMAPGVSQELDEAYLRNKNIQNEVRVCD